VAGKSAKVANIIVGIIIKMSCLFNGINVLLLKHPQATGTQATIVQFANVLYLANIQGYGAALALRKLIGLALKRGVATLAADDLVFGCLGN
jgi:hypothetical protein